MLCLVSGTTTSAAKYAADIGRFVEPRGRSRPENLHLQPNRWAMDNGAFKDFDRAAFVTMLERFYPHRAGCLFVAAPDVVGDAAATLARWPFWSRLIRGLGYRVALVAQDGLTVGSTPWEELDALFIGGTTAWKLSQRAATLAGVAKARGLWVHVGRVNSARRLRWVSEIGGDSYDGTGTSRYGDIKIPLRLRDATEIRQTPRMVF